MTPTAQDESRGERTRTVKRQPRRPTPCRKMKAASIAQGCIAPYIVRENPRSDQTTNEISPQLLLDVYCVRSTVYDTFYDTVYDTVCRTNCVLWRRTGTQGSSLFVRTYVRRKVVVLVADTGT